MVNSEKCTGCGACITICPVDAISFKYFSNQEIPITIESYSEKIGVSNE
jgi:ferredoxin